MAGQDSSSFRDDNETQTYRDDSQTVRDESSLPEQSLGHGTQAMLGSVASPLPAGVRDRRQAVQYSPSAHIAAPRNAKPSGPTGLIAADIDSSELPGMALIDVDRYVGLALDIPTSGFLPLILAGFDDERTSGSPLSEVLEQDPGMKTVWQSICDSYFCSMNEQVLIEAIAGNIDLAYQKSQSDGTDVASYIDKLRDRASFHPSVYVRPLTDTNGSAMSLDHYEQMLDIAERYCGRDVLHAEEAYDIDSVADEDIDNSSQTMNSQGDTGWSLEDSENGIRRHLQTSANEFSESRAKCLRAWIAAGRARINHCRSQGIGLAPPMQYVGYAMNATNRRKGHESRNSASWLSLLVSDICAVQWPGLYSLKFYVIALIVDPQMGQLCEIIFSRFLRAYTVNGGLNIDWAGKSTSSLFLSTKSDAERQDFWERKREWVRMNLDYEANGDVELERRKALYEGEFKKQIAAANERTAQGNEKIAKIRVLADEVKATVGIIKDKGGKLDPEDEAQIEERHRLGNEIAKR
ncbi:hypothetical protein J4E86_006918 [Alternaria arbusti]|uniref:uncharacterized protein n=1 Tax=Alternaria arbusti TaxID=232088 RepID=UPI00221F4101|nr:uncharacterized protein J4E86_006918 [Alternaria arbusti]KAI4953375.1 hypothetical protein J4E86_006918 [Alternaria arbusti]